MLRELVTLREEATGRIWAGKVTRAIAPQALCNTVYTDPVSYGLKGAFVSSPLPLRGLVQGSECILGIGETAVLVPVVLA